MPTVNTGESDPGTALSGSVRRVLRPAEEVFMGPSSLLAALDGPATYLSWGWLQISIPNFVVILVMLLVFVAAILLPFPKDREDRR